MTQNEHAALTALLTKYHHDPLGREASTDASTLLRCARTLQRHALRRCNDPLTDAEEKRLDRLDHQAETEVQHIMALYGARASFDGDPRGYVVKLHFPPKPGMPYDGRVPANTWGGDECGYGIGDL